jgi:hypothetical protein
MLGTSKVLTDGETVSVVVVVVVDVVPGIDGMYYWGSEREYREARE